VSFLLDTNVCIALLTGRAPEIAERLRFLSPTEIRLCSVVKAELLHGARRSGKPAENLRLLAEFFSPFDSLPFDDRCAERYGVLRTELEVAGTPIGPNDLMIAATALAFDVTLVTRNESEFGRVVGLRFESWQA
jgi:tRNA(fMet)-specific endonuclease VapC